MSDIRANQVEDIRSAIYPPARPSLAGSAVVHTPAALAEPEERDAVSRSRRSSETAELIAGRLIFGGYFIYNGINHFLNRKMLADYARLKGTPAADVAVVASGALILAGGLSILTGARPKIGSALIATFLIGVSPRMHAFWNEEDPRQRMQEMVNFSKNMALVGASLLAAAHPEPWPWHVGTRSETPPVPAHA